MSKKNMSEEQWSDLVKTLREEITVLTNQLEQLEQTRSEQVQELLTKQGEAMKDIADLFLRYVRAKS